MTERILEGADLPPGVHDLAQPPEHLRLHGVWPDGPVVALVGTRHPSPEGLAFTHRLSAELARAGVVVASGGAEGIDTAAHEGALDRGARTLVVAPCGFRRPFPERNAALFQAIVARGGGFVSEHEPSTPARRHLFFRRNALLVALSRLVVMVESPFRSGARNAALWARRLGRPWLVVPHSPWNARGTGWIAEHRLGAGIVNSSRDVLAALERSNLHAIPEATAAPTQLALPLESSLEATLLALLEQPMHLDELVERTRANPAAVQGALTELCLHGLASVGALGVAVRSTHGRKEL